MIDGMKREIVPVPINRLPDRRSAIRLATASNRRANDPAANWWMITFSDLTVLLLGFAVLWYATVTPSMEPAPAQIARPAEPEAQSLPVPATTERETWQAVQNDLAQFVGAAGLRQDVAVESASGEILLSMRDSVPFDSGKADLREKALPVLDKIAAVVLANPKISVAVSGHTDRVRIANPAFPSNWELSTARASRVARYLIQRGLRPSSIAVQGYADQRPKNLNFTPAARRANRRVEIRLLHESSTGAGASAEKQP
jgi:chemotaxis protein MotB